MENLATDSLSTLLRKRNAAQLLLGEIELEIESWLGAVKFRISQASALARGQKLPQLPNPMPGRLELKLNQI